MSERFAMKKQYQLKTAEPANGHLQQSIANGFVRNRI
jgi:hypothetical protein